MNKQKIQIGRKIHVISRFADVHEFVDYALGGFENETVSRVFWRGSMKRNETLDEWYTGGGVAMTISDVAAAVMAPSPECRQLNIDMPGDCAIRQRAFARRVRRGLDSGDDVDVERWAVRDLACFGDVERVRCGRPSVRVVVDFSANCNQNHDYFVSFTSMLAAVVEMAESANVNISVDVCFSGRMVYNSSVGHYVHNVVRLKCENEMLDKNLLLYVCGDQAFYRALVMQAELRMAAESWPDKKIGAGAAHCAAPHDSITARSFVVSVSDVDRAGDVLRKFYDFIEQGEGVAAAC